jgi:uncharacterized membrane protein YgdD (TMEM256/DUF423 family)
MKQSVIAGFNPSRVFAAGALSAAVAVGLGAFGAHALRSTLAAQELVIYETAVRYQMYHALALLAAGLGGKFWAPANPRNFRTAGWCFAIGTLLFSGSLYGLSLSGAKWLAYLTPIGGTLFLGGWIFLFVAALSSSTPSARH